MRNPHVLAIPYPAQGHIIPLMELSLRLTTHGIKVTFLNTEKNHKKVQSSWDLRGTQSDLIHLVAIPDGSKSTEEGNRIVNSSEEILRNMPGKVEEIIDRINKPEEEDDDKICCVLVDTSVAWALEIAAKKGIQRVAFSPAAAVNDVILSGASKLIEDGIIDEHGTPRKKQMFKLSVGMPEMSTAELVWVCFDDTNTQKHIFNLAVANNNLTLKLSDWRICNSTYVLEPATIDDTNNHNVIIPIGPLLASNRLRGQTVGSLWLEDPTCLEWLDHQPPRSVIYVSLGSTFSCEPTQFKELVIGLELTGRPFLLVAREGISSIITTNYLETLLTTYEVGKLGKLVAWAPQQQVLGHPSVACFLSHCGWNSTLEGVSNGVPILCWPYFADQFFNSTYVCDVWKVGIRLHKDKSGLVISGEDIRDKVEELLGDEEIKERAMELGELVMASVKEGGGSYTNFVKFVDWIKGLEN